MNERLTIQDFIDLLAAKHSMTKKDAEAFVKEFFLLIEQALENEKYLKIKGLGTFKLIDVDSRESVNVNTGERFQIKGHTKVSFSPDSNLRDTINKPFSHFETVVLNENTVLEDTSVEETQEDETGEEISAQVVEDKKKEADQIQEEPIAEGIIIELQTEESVAENKVLREQVIEEGILPEATEVEEIIIQSEEVKDVVSKQQSAFEEGKNEVPTAESIIAKELAKANLESVSPKAQPEIVRPILPATKIIAQKEKSPVPYLIAIIIIVLLLCGGAVVYIYYPDLFTSSANKDIVDMPITTQPMQPEAQLLDSIKKKDTVAAAISNMPKEKVTVSQPIEKAEPETSVKAESKTTQEQSLSPVYSDSASYTITGTKATHTIKEGETLTKVSLRYFGTKGMWPYIVKHNPEVIKNPDNVPYGTKIKIPELTKK